MSDPRRELWQDSLRRWCVFTLVGLMGILLQLAILSLLRGMLGLHYMLATALAVEGAILHNFLWHESWTWADRHGSRGDGTLSRLVRFNLGTGSVSIVSNLVFMELFVGCIGVHYLPANILSIALASIVNFTVSDRFVFLRTERRSELLGRAIRRNDWRRC